MMMMAMWARPTGTANAAHGGQALLVRFEPAIRGTATNIVMSAPVSFSGLRDAKRNSEKSESD
jgi:hypothetical protein